MKAFACDGVTVCAFVYVTGKAALNEADKMLYVRKTKNGLAVLDSQRFQNVR
jgi:hypothetical protein